MGINRNRNSDPLVPVYLEEMIGAIEAILTYTKGLSFDSFMQQAMLQDAVQHQFEILGEASSHLPFSIKRKFQTIPFKWMYALRNHIAHEYFDVDYEILWHIIQVDLPQNCRDLHKALEIQRESAAFNRS